MILSRIEELGSGIFPTFFNTHLVIKIRVFYYTISESIFRFNLRRRRSLHLKNLSRIRCKCWDPTLYCSQWLLKFRPNFRNLVQFARIENVHCIIVRQGLDQINPFLILALMSVDYAVGTMRMLVCSTWSVLQQSLWTKRPPLVQNHSHTYTNNT